MHAACHAEKLWEVNLQLELIFDLCHVTFFFFDPSFFAFSIFNENKILVSLEIEQGVGVMYSGTIYTYFLFKK